MTPNTPSPSTQKKPVSVWNRAIDADFKGMFSDLTRAVGQGITGNWFQAMSSGLKALKSVKLKQEPGELAWLLVRCGIMRAVYTLVKDYGGSFNSEMEPDLVNRLDLSLEDYELELGPALFVNPGELPLLEELKPVLQVWLQGAFSKETRCREIVARLNAYFVAGLHDEWYEEFERYQPVATYWKDSPFAEADIREKSWLRYHAWLQMQPEEPIFQEPFGLARVYIQPRGWYTEKKPKNDDHRIHKQAMVINDHLKEWLKNGEKNDPLRFISGGPGCGKSSFCKMFAAEVSKMGNLKTLLIPLHLIDMKGDLIEAVGKFAGDNNFKHNPLDREKGDQRLLIIFDGLDELAMQGKVGMETAREFVRQVQNRLHNVNYQNLRMQAIISGRELILNQNLAELRHLRQLLHVLPFYLDDQEREKYEDPLKILEEDQRHLWWLQFGKATGRNYESMPEPLRDKNYRDITEQPLLNYLLALSFIRGKIDFQKNNDLNTIYADLLDAVYERNWEPHSHHKTIEGLVQKDFERILEEIAIAVRHGNGRTATIKELKDHCHNQHLTPKLESFQKSAEEGVTCLLTAFYFRQSGERRDGDQTFEFTHKSFAEYLSARRMVDLVRRLEKNICSHDKDPDEGWSVEDGLTHWARLFGPTALDEDLIVFIENELRNRDVDEITRWQNALCKAIEWVLTKGMPMEKLGLKRYGEMYRQARNAEEALLVLTSLSGEMNEKPAKIKWPTAIAAGTWLYFLQGQRSGPRNTPTLNHLAFIDFGESVLDFHDFYRANLRGAHLRGAHLRQADLRGAHLRQADLRQADLRGAHLRQADLLGAHLHKADLSGADLSGAVLRVARLRGTKLGEADLRGAKLGEADLRGAKLDEADLGGAKLGQADLRGARLFGAKLGAADLRDADLRDADLRDVDLRDADLRDVDLRDADLRGADLRDAYLRGADFRVARLQHTTFGDNPGLTEDQKSEIQKLGGIFL